MNEETLEGNDLMKVVILYLQKNLAVIWGVSWVAVEQRQPFLCATRCATLYTISGLPVYAWLASSDYCRTDNFLQWICWIIVCCKLYNNTPIQLQQFSLYILYVFHTIILRLL